MQKTPGTSFQEYALSPWAQTRLSRTQSIQHRQQQRVYFPKGRHPVNPPAMHVHHPHCEEDSFNQQPAATKRICDSHLPSSNRTILPRQHLKHAFHSSLKMRSLFVCGNEDSMVCRRYISLYTRERCLTHAHVWLNAPLSEGANENERNEEKRVRSRSCTLVLKKRKEKIDPPRSGFWYPDAPSPASLPPPFWMCDSAGYAGLINYFDL